MDFRTYLLVSFPINFYAILWLINLLFKWTFPDALWRTENKHHIQNTLLSFAQTVNVGSEQLLTRCLPLSSDEILLEILLCMFHSMIKNGPEVCASFLCLHGWCPQAFLCASLRDHLDLFSTCMCVSRAHMNMCRMVTGRKPLIWQTCVCRPRSGSAVRCGCRRKAALFCISVCVWTCLYVVWSKAEKSLQFTWEQMTGSGFSEPV